jgi:hypothetical protein
MAKLFYKTCRHGNVGSNVMFHNKDEFGYGTNLKNLEVYTKEEAQEYMDRQDGSLMLLKSEVDKLAVKHVDMQYLDETKGGPSKLNDLCVVQINGNYDGNDIKFCGELGSTFDLSKARVISHQEALLFVRDGMTIWSASYLESISRYTFQAGNINKRKMITAGGVRYRTPRASRTTGKARGNCPTCGKITWDFNPYENAYCQDHDDTQDNWSY